MHALLVFQASNYVDRTGNLAIWGSCFQKISSQAQPFGNPLNTICCKIAVTPGSLIIVSLFSVSVSAVGTCYVKTVSGGISFRR